MTRERVVSTLVVLASAALAAWAIHADEAWFMTHWMRHQCFLDRTSENEVLVARVVAGLLAVLLLVVVRPWLARVSVGGFLRVGIAVAFSLLVTELYLRHKAKASGPAAPTPHAWLYHRGRQSLDVFVGGRSIHFALDRNGYRVRNDSDSVDLAAPSIVVAGESVALGVGVEYDETIGALLAGRTGLQDVNLGIIGFSNASTLQRLRDELPKIEKPVAVVVFVVHTWLNRNTDRQNWHVDWNEGREMPILPPVPATQSPLRNMLGTIFRYHDEHRFEVGRLVLEETADFIRSRNAKPLFVFTQCGARCRSTSFVVSELTRGLPAPWISIDTPETENLVGDMHPGPTATPRYAEAIEKALRAQGVAP